MEGDAQSSPAGEDFYPRSPCGERLEKLTEMLPTFLISIHALLAESDRRFRSSMYESPNFYPRSPCGERPTKISRSNQTIINFYPRSPCGERRHLGFLWPSRLRFLSTLSLRRATKHIVGTSQVFQNFYPRSPCGERPHNSASSLPSISISIHALLAESDPSANVKSSP